MNGQKKDSLVTVRKMITSKTQKRQKRRKVNKDTQKVKTSVSVHSTLSESEHKEKGKAKTY